MRPSSLQATMMLATMTKPDPLIALADAVIEDAYRLREELDRSRAAARAIRRHGQQQRALQIGLSPAVSISLFVRRRLGEGEQPLTSVPTSRSEQPAGRFDRTS